MDDNSSVSILKPLWSRRPDRQWEICGLKGITLQPKQGSECDFFLFEDNLELMASSPPRNMADLFASFGSSNSLLKQSILPVVAWVAGNDTIRCIGTAFVISASGYIVTASHVLLDPMESGYGKYVGNAKESFPSNVLMGVIIPLNPATGVKGFHFVPIDQAWYWGTWEESPLIHEADRLKHHTDVAVCKLPERADGSAYQALSLSLFPFEKGEGAFTIGYAEMMDIPVRYVDGRPVLSEFKHELYVSVGEVTEVYPNNHIEREIPTPGPAFNFQARVPGKMSGGPIFGAGGAVIRGVVSRSFQDEKHASGCMIGPALTLPFGNESSLKKIMDAGTEGMAIIHGRGL